MLSTVPTDKGHFCIQWMKWISSHLSKPLFALIQWYPREGEETSKDNPQDNNFYFRSSTQFLLCKRIMFAWNKSYHQEPDNPNSRHLTWEGRLSLRGGGVGRSPEATCNVPFLSQLTVEVSVQSGVTA